MKILQILVLVFSLLGFHSVSFADQDISNIYYSQNYPDFNSAISTAGITGGTLIINTPLAVNGAITVQSNITLVFAQGGKLFYGPAATGSILVDLDCPIHADNFQIFFGNNLNVEINIEVNPFTLSAWGTFTTTGVPIGNFNIYSNLFTSNILVADGFYLPYSNPNLIGMSNYPYIGMGDASHWTIYSPPLSLNPNYGGWGWEMWMSGGAWFWDPCTYNYSGGSNVSGGCLHPYNFGTHSLGSSVAPWAVVNALSWANGSTLAFNTTSSGNLTFQNLVGFNPTTYSSLTTMSIGSTPALTYCNNCNVASPCTSGGAGAFAVNKTGLTTGWNCPF